METTVNNPAARLYQLVRKYANEEVPAEATNILEENIKHEIDERAKVLATREDLLILHDDLLKMESKIESKFNDQLKWIIVMFIGLYGAIILQWIFKK